MLLGIFSLLVSSTIMVSVVVDATFSGFFSVLLGLISVLWIVAIVILWAAFLSGVSTGRYTVNDEGMTMYIGRRAYAHSWDDFSCCYITDTKYISFGTKKSLYWVCFSKRMLSEDEQKPALMYALKNPGDLSFFQYDEKRLADVMVYLPDAWQEY